MENITIDHNTLTRQRPGMEKHNKYNPLRSSLCISILSPALHLPWLRCVNSDTEPARLLTRPSQKTICPHPTLQQRQIQPPPTTSLAPYLEGPLVSCAVLHDYDYYKQALHMTCDFTPGLACRTSWLPACNTWCPVAHPRAKDLRLEWQK